MSETPERANKEMSPRLEEHDPLLTFADLGSEYFPEVSWSLPVSPIREQFLSTSEQRADEKESMSRRMDWMVDTRQQRVEFMSPLQPEAGAGETRNLAAFDSAVYSPGTAVAAGKKNALEMRVQRKRQPYNCNKCGDKKKYHLCLYDGGRRTKTDKTAMKDAECQTPTQFVYEDESAGTIMLSSFVASPDDKYFGDSVLGSIASSIAYAKWCLERLWKLAANRNGSEAGTIEEV